ncbi:MAG: hypothetical protein AB1488_06485 [Nitrospirota bacterium]
MKSKKLIKKKKKEMTETNVRIKYFAIVTNRPEEFIEKLEKLCSDFAVENDYFKNFSFEG